MDGPTEVSFTRGFIEYHVESGGECYRFCHTLHDAIATHRAMGRAIQEALASGEPIPLKISSG